MDSEQTEEKRHVTVKVFVDVCLVLLCGGAIPLVWHHVKAPRRGFFCDDENIMYPSKHSRVSNAVLWGFCVLVPCAIICLTEVLRKLNKEEDSANEVYFFGRKVPNTIQQIYKIGMVYMLGLLMTELSNDFIKSIVGRLRPNFLALCKPSVNCSNEKNPHFYVEDYKCTNPDLWNENYIRISFPSGHTALTTYAGFYVLIYLQKRMTFNRYSMFLKPILLWLVLMPGGFISLSRIADYMHHGDDVLAGFVLGLLLCVILMYNMTDLLKKEVKENACDELHKN